MAGGFLKYKLQNLLSFHNNIWDDLVTPHDKNDFGSNGLRFLFQ